MASSHMENQYPWYAIDGRISANRDNKIFATEYQISPYFMLQLSYLTNVIGITITSRNEVEDAIQSLQSTNDTSITNFSGIQSINSVEIRMGTIKVMDNLCEKVGNPQYTNCSRWEGNELCGVLSLDGDILPLREYTVRCGKSIPSTFVTLQLPTSDDIKRSLTFEEVKLILGNFFDEKEPTSPSISIHDSSGIISQTFK